MANNTEFPTSPSSVAQHNEEENQQQQQQRTRLRIILPRGYLFRPLDFELLLHYLKNKILDLPLSCSLIKEIDIYNCSIEELKKKGEFVNGGKDSYFFIINDPKYPTITGPWGRGNRITSDGYWKPTSGDVNIFLNHDHGGGEIIGFKKSFVFYFGKGQQTAKKTNWIMHEYRLNFMQTLSAVERSALSTNQMKNCVLCRIQNTEETTQETCTWTYREIEDYLKRRREEEFCTIDNTTEKDDGGSSSLRTPTKTESAAGFEKKDSGTSKKTIEIQDRKLDTPTETLLSSFEVEWVEWKKFAPTCFREKQEEMEEHDYNDDQIQTSDEVEEEE